MCSPQIVCGLNTQHNIDIVGFKGSHGHLLWPMSPILGLKVSARISNPVSGGQCHSSHHPLEVLLAKYSLYVKRRCPKHHSFHFATSHIEIKRVYVYIDANKQLFTYDYILSLPTCPTGDCGCHRKTNSFFPTLSPAV